MRIKAFKAFRPVPELADKVAFSPNNLMNEPERRETARLNPYSYAHIVKPRLDLPDDMPKNDPQLFEHAKSYFDKLIREGALLRDEEPCLYVYKLIMTDHTQTGLICCSFVEDYFEGRIKKHENTRAEKEEENVQHISKTLLNSNPVFLAYNPVADIDKEIFYLTQTQKPDYDFISDLGVQQQLWVVKHQTDIDLLTQLFHDKVECAYIADGHHRAASAALYAKIARQQYDGKVKYHDYNYFLTCYFPSNQLKIYDYNRLVKDLNGLTEKEFMTAIEKNFSVFDKKQNMYTPKKQHRFGMYLNHEWYKLKAFDGTFADDAMSVLDVSILQNNLLEPVLGIHDPRTDKRVDFIHGVNGLQSLQKQVDKGKAAVAFSLYPVSMEQLFAISDRGEVMPPKSTWFEPKLLSGLVIYKMELE